MAKKVKIDGMEYSNLIANALSFFWNTKKRQLTESSDASNRGAVLGGKQMDGFVDLQGRLPLMLAFLTNLSLRTKTICQVIFVHRKTGTCL